MFSRWMTAASLLAWPLLASAQDAPDFVPGEEVAAQKAADQAETDKPPEGWSLKLEVGTNISFADNRSVVGVEDGTTFQIGLQVKGEANYRHGQHKWRNSLDLSHAQTSAPPLDEFIKSNDNFELRSMYLYSLESVPWLGPFARARLQTQLFDGYLIKATDTTVSIDGGETTVLPAREKFALTDPFEPLLLRQSLGAFVAPLERKDLTVIITLGGGAQEILTNENLSSIDDPATEDVVEVAHLKDSTQIGAEIEVDASGAVEKNLSWSFKASILYPFYSDPDATLNGKVLEGAELINAEIAAKVSAKITSWASLDYVLSARYLPLIVDEWQVQNGLLVSAAFNLL